MTPYQIEGIDAPIYAKRYVIQGPYLTENSVEIIAECSKNEKATRNNDYYFLELFFSVDDYGTREPTPVFGEKAAHNGKVTYSLDFEVTPHQLRHTYITNLIHASVDPKTVQYLAGHESSKITMDIYAKVKYNRPDELVSSMSEAFANWEAV